MDDILEVLKIIYLISNIVYISCYENIAFVISRNKSNISIEKFH